MVVLNAEGTVRWNTAEMQRQSLISGISDAEFNDGCSSFFVPSSWNTYTPPPPPPPSMIKWALFKDPVLKFDRIMVKFKKISIEEMIRIASLTTFGVGRHMENTEIVEEFGATPEILILQWRLLCPVLPDSSKPHHLLWWLYHCKHYPTKKMFQKAMRVSPPTARKATKPIKEGFLQIRNKVVSISPSEWNNINAASYLSLFLRHCWRSDGKIG